MKISDVAKLTGVTVRTLHVEEHSRFLELESLIQEKMTRRRYTRTSSPRWKI